MSDEKEVLAIVDNVLKIEKKNLSPSTLDEIRLSLTRENPDYHRMKMMVERNRIRMANAILPPATIVSYEEDERTLFLPRGVKDSLKESLAEIGLKLSIIDETRSYPPDLEMRINENVQLISYQKKALGAAVMNRQGVIVAPCGAGKTVTGVAILSTLRQPTLVLVHTLDLAQQWLRELAEKSFVGRGVGLWGGGKRQQSQVTLATIQSLIRLPPNELTSLLASFGCVILDEAHHCPANTFLSIVNQCPAKYRFGLTATPRRKDGLEFLMHDVIGPIVSEITDDDLKSSGRSQNCTVKTINTVFYSRYTADNWSELIGELCSDIQRNRLIIDTILQTFNEGHFPLILSDRVDHCNYLNNLLRERGMNSHLLIGTINKNQREQTIRMARENKIDAIVATKVADEGLDIPQLSCVHLVTPSSNEAKTQQRIGRIRRPIEGKKSLVVDYVDLRIPSLFRMSKVRKTLYRRWGFELA